MPTSQHPIELYPAAKISELLDADLTPENLLKRLNDSVPDLDLLATQIILQPKAGLRTPRSVIEGSLQELANHPPMIDGDGKVTLICKPGQIEALYITVSALMRSYPVLDFDGSKFSKLRELLYKKMQIFGFTEDTSETPPDLYVDVDIEQEINKES